MTRAGNRLTAAWARVRNIVPALVACLLVALGIALAVRTEQQSVVVRADQVTVQARIMAAALTGALAFDDVAATREYLAALKLNPDVRAAAVYSRAGRRVAGFSKGTALFPRRIAPHPAMVSNMVITVVEPVRQGSLDLGAVYIQSSIEPLGVRLSRYVAVGLMIVFAALLIWLLGRSFARAAEANDRLRAEIVAREQAERALIQAQKMEALGHLTGGIAHDFNNLLMAASSGLELLQRSSDPERQQKFTQGIKEALDRGARLTRQLLAFARHSPVHPEVVDVAGRLRGIEDLLDRSLRENIAMVYDLDDDLWPIDVDPVQFEVAIVNIAVNARDAMPQGGAIRISASNVGALPTSDEAVRITIADQGCGMPPDLLQKVFDPFFTTKPVGQGTGLGLSQVYGFVRNAGGHVEIDSTENRGTTISLTLPRSARTAPERPARPAQVDTQSVKPRTVLVVEDDPRIAESLGEMLRHLGCSALWTHDPDEALRMIATSDIDVVLSDMVMPGGVNGLDLATTMRQRGDAMQVILMTGYSDDAERARQEGFVMLDKPFTLNALVEALNGTAT